MGHRAALFAAAAFGFCSVAFGAFGAHALKDYFSSFDDAAKRMEWWHTATEYQMVHALLLLGIATLLGRAGANDDSDDNKPLRRSAALASVGIVLFSGSLYAMALSGVHMLGVVTPFGGLCFLASWTLLAVFAFSRR